MQSMATTRPWDAQPGETPKAFSAFQAYLKMPLVGAASEKRSLANLAAKMGHASTTGVERWSAKYDWVARSLAYDAYVSTSVLTVREGAIKDFQQAIITRMGAQLAVVDDLIEHELAKLRKAQQAGEEVGATTLKKLVDTLVKKDDLARRMAQLPTQYTSARVDDSDEDDTVYVIGGA